MLAARSSAVSKQLCVWRQYWLSMCHVVEGCRTLVVNFIQSFALNVTKNHAGELDFTYSVLTNQIVAVWFVLPYTQFHCLLAASDYHWQDQLHSTTTRKCSCILCIIHILKICKCAILYMYIIITTVLGGYSCTYNMVGRACSACQVNVSRLSYSAAQFTAGEKGREEFCWEHTVRSRWSEQPICFYCVKRLLPILSSMHVL